MISSSESHWEQNIFLGKKNDCAKICAKLITFCEKTFIRQEKMTTTYHEALSLFWQELNDMQEKLQSVAQLQDRVNEEIMYENKMRLYKTMNLTMDAFDKQKLSVMQLYEQLQKMVSGQETIEMNKLMQSMNLI